MLFHQIPLGTWFNTKISLDITVIVMCILVSSSFISEFVSKDIGFYSSVFFSILVSITLYLFVLLHEFGHIFTLRRFGYECDKITLFIFGGMAHLKSNIIKKPSHEFWIVLNGPLVSYGLSIVFLLLGILFKIANFNGFSYFSIVMGLINFVVATFNILFLSLPFDGGRLLRSIVWEFSGNWLLATKICIITFPVVVTLFFIFYLTSLNILNIFFFILAALICYSHWPRENRDFIFLDDNDNINMSLIFNNINEKKELYVIDMKGKVRGHIVANIENFSFHAY